MTAKRTPTCDSRGQVFRDRNGRCRSLHRGRLPRPVDTSVAVGRASRNSRPQISHGLQSRLHEVLQAAKLVRIQHSDEASQDVVVLLSFRCRYRAVSGAATEHRIIRDPDT